MTIDKAELRRIMGHFATGVTVITTRNDRGEPVGLTANAVTSVSLNPPLILICVDKGAECYPWFAHSKVFVVNILSEEQESLSRKFATRGAVSR
jgi:flavin reductase (DIM6/NTAB) family NADH-FMN oxidoreductase RutF